MPQMAPMSWMMLFMFFTITLISFSAINYYIYIPNMKKSGTKTLENFKMNWKW